MSKGMKAAVSTATANLRRYVQEHPEEVERFGGPLCGDLANALMAADEEGFVQIPRVVRGRERSFRMRLEDYVQEALRPLIDAEGTSIFTSVDTMARNTYARVIFESLDYFDEINYNYTDATATVDRSSPKWRLMQRRNITLPTGLAYEVAAVVDQLGYASPPVRISLSGLLEVALRELLRHPADPNDARYTPGDETIADIIAREDIGLRRRGATATS